LSVGSGTDTDKLKEVFGAANVLAVDEVGEVTRRIRDLCRHALKSVSRRRLAPLERCYPTRPISRSISAR
jgi:hypothetical protein